MWIIKIKCFYPPQIINEHWCIYSCLQIPPRENWFQYVRRVYATAINFPCIITLEISILSLHLLRHCELWQVFLYTCTTLQKCVLYLGCKNYAKQKKNHSLAVYILQFSTTSYFQLFTTTTTWLISVPYRWNYMDPC